MDNLIEHNIELMNKLLNSKKFKFKSINELDRMKTKEIYNYFVKLRKATKYGYTDVSWYQPDYVNLIDEKIEDKKSEWFKSAFDNYILLLKEILSKREHIPRKKQIVNKKRYYILLKKDINGWVKYNKINNDNLNLFYDKIKCKDKVSFNDFVLLYNAIKTSLNNKK